MREIQEASKRGGSYFKSRLIIMTKETRQALEQERDRIRVLAKELIAQIKEARNAENWNLFEKLEDELDILRRKQKQILYKLGLRKYSDDETVEYAPGQFMKASEYYWLIND